MIALAALVMQAGLTKGVLADGTGMRLAPAPATQSSSPAPVTGSLRSERVLSLLLTSWLPCFLKEAEATVANAAAEGLSAEDLAIVEEATMAILSGLPNSCATKK